MHVAAAPRISRSIHGQRALSSNNEMMWILLFLGHVHGCGAVPAWHIETFSFVLGCTIEEPGDCFSDQFDVTDFFDPDALNQIEVGFAVAPEVETLKEVLHHRAHFTELSTEAFLQCISRGGIRFIIDDWIY